MPLDLPAGDYISPALQEALADLEERGNAETLKRYWTEGEGAAKIRWGTAGDFMRCVRHLGKYIADPKGYCSDMHVRATGARPGHAPTESATGDAMDDHQVFETSQISEAEVAEAKRTGKMLMQFISPGWGTSGYYSPQVLEDAAAERVIPKGTHMYADHPTNAEAIERPGRSIKDLMAITVEDARVGDNGALVGKVQIVPHWQPFVETVAEHIGVSIRGDAKDITMGEAEGRSGKIIEGLAHVASVDFVTRAGRGGKVLATAVESAAANRRAIGHGIDEATVNDTRDALHRLVSDTYGAKDVYCYVRDFDASTVWFQVSANGEQHLYAQPYTGEGPSLALDGDRTEVRQVTSYVPVSTGATESLDTDVPATRPDGSNTHESHEENQMGTKQIEESEYTRLTEAAGRVQTLESERDTAVQERDTAVAERDEARGDLAARDRRDAARAIVEKADVQFGPLEVKGLLADLPVKEGSTELDSEAFQKAVDEAAATVKEARGAGRITGFGGDPIPGGDELSEADLNKVVAGAFGRDVKGA